MVSQEMYQLGAKRSCIRELFEYGLELARKIGPENVYDYSLGNPSVPAPGQVAEQLAALADRDPVALHSYTPASGTVEARKRVADDITARTGREIFPEDLFFTCGAAPALTAVFSALRVENSEIVAIAPCFPEYAVFVEGTGSKFVLTPPDVPDFQIPMAALEERINEHTQAVIINSPNNPSGVIYSRETLKQLAEMLTRKSREAGHPIYLISDEPYRELAYDGTEVPFVPEIYGDTILCYSYSKSLSMPGERIGYICIPSWVTDNRQLMAAVMGAARVQGHVCAPSLMQQVIARCTDLRPDVDTYDRNRKLLYQSLTEYGYRCVRPQGAFYLFAEAPGGDAQAFSQRAKERGLLLVPGDDFGCPGYFRLSTCVDYDMIRRSLPLFRELIQAS